MGHSTGLPHSEKELFPHRNGKKADNGVGGAALGMVGHWPRGWLQGCPLLTVAGEQVTLPWEWWAIGPVAGCRAALCSP